MKERNEKIFHKVTTHKTPKDAQGLGVLVGAATRSYAVIMVQESSRCTEKALWELEHFQSTVKEREAKTKASQEFLENLRLQYGERYLWRNDPAQVRQFVEDNREWLLQNRANIREAYIKLHQEEAQREVAEQLKRDNPNLYARVNEVFHWTALDLAEQPIWEKVEPEPDTSIETLISGAVEKFKKREEEIFAGRDEIIKLAKERGLDEDETARLLRKFDTEIRLAEEESRRQESSENF